MRVPVFVNTDVFLSFLLGREDRHYREAREIFSRAESGRLKLITTEFVILDIVGALGREYGFSRQEVCEVIEAILNTRNLKVPNRDLLLSAVERYSAGELGFTTAYALSFSKARGLRMAAFDRSLFREGIEPYAG